MSHAVDGVGTIDVVLHALKSLDLRDLLLPVSLGALLYGIAQWSGPAAWVTAGALGLALWLRPHFRKVG
jgi:hypothetical protein